MKLQKKVLTIILPVISIFLTLCALGIFSYLNNNLKDNLNFKNQQNLNQINIYLNSYQKQRIKDVSFISNIEEVNEYISSSGSIRYNEKQKNLIKLFDSALNDNKNIEEYFLINNKREFLFSYSREIFYDDRDDREKISKHFKNYKVKKGEVFVTFEKLKKGNRILYIKRFKNKGYLVIAENINFFNYYAKTELQNNSALFLIKNNTIIDQNINFSNEKHLGIYKHIISDITENEYETGYKSKTKNYHNSEYFTYLIKSENKFHIFGMISTKESEQTILGFVYSTVIFTILLTILITLTIFYSMNKLIIKPIHSIDKASKSISQGEYGLLFDKSKNDEISNLSNTLSDVCQNIVETNEKIHKIAYFDELTGLPNKRNFDLESIEKFKKAEFNQEELAILLIDLDDFKEINDTFGHDMGDQFLKTISLKFKRSIEEAITENNYEIYHQVSRIAGDDFVILLQGENLIEATKKISEIILKNTSDKIYLDDKSFFPSATIGICVYPEHSNTLKQTYQLADMAMYQAKHSGKNKYTFINEDILNEKKEQEELSKDIKEALIHDDFYLNFQPKYNIKTGKYNNFEALIRWNHKEKGFISPVVFIPFAEKSNLIVKIGDWVIYNVCKNVKILEQMGWVDFKISLNVSYKQLQEHDFISNLKANIEKHKINPKHLEIEITEHSIVKDLSQAQTDLKNIRELGISVSLDDFGTGYSSLIYLQSLPLDILKIDRAFISKSTSSKESRAIIKTIITLAQGLGLKTVAEGVETKEEYELLKSYDCDFIQGFYFYKPLDFGKIIEIKNKEKE
jgi:diguanylate cyclase (GGDEF)-like protein